MKFVLVFRKLRPLTCSRISRLKLNKINGFIEERHNSKLLHVKWSNFQPLHWYENVKYALCHWQGILSENRKKVHI